MKVIPCLLAVFPAIAGAAEGLPLLQVDPALLEAPAKAPPRAPAPTPASAAPGAAEVIPVPAPGRGAQDQAAPAGSSGSAPVAAPANAASTQAPAAAPGDELLAPADPGATVVVADRIGGQQDIEMVAEGDAQLARDGTRMRADRIVYREVEDEVEASGDVRMWRGEDIITAPRATLQMAEQTGEVETPRYEFSRVVPARDDETMSRTVVGSGGADVLKLEGENQYALENATWSTCKPADPDWYLKAGELELDYDRDVGTVRDTTVVFKDVPIFYMPWAEFPLAAQRKSGLLPPTFGTSNKTGVDLTVPYYWNIAPNYDATFAPRYMSRRGFLLGGEYRYLADDLKGSISAEWLPRDEVSGQTNRAAASVRHTQALGSGFNTYINYNSVSDKAYLEDLNTQLSVASQTNLLREAGVTYSPGSWWSAGVLAQSYQTLTGETPYRRLPQLTAGGRKAFFDDRADFVMSSEWVRFAHPDASKPEGSRFTVYPSIEMPLGGTAYSLTPKVGVNFTRYSLNRPLVAGEEQINRTLPIFSLDGKVAFERETTWGGTEAIQTLEPRVYYVRVPYEDQSMIPNFDSGLYDFNFAQIFSENIFSGGDRISNANQITAAVTSRLIDASTGVERMKFAVGQRYYFADQRVTLPDVAPRTGRRADVLASFEGRLSKDVSLDTGWQYNPREKETERFNAGLRYQPGFAQVFNIGYRYTRDVLRDLDLSAQWPIARRWYAVARYNRSLRDHRVTEALAGLEYAGDCWVLRTAFHRFATTENDVTQAIFLQLELTDLASVGSSPVDLLKRSVEGYGIINQSMADPVFGAR